MRRACVVTLVEKYDSIEIIGDSKCGRFVVIECASPYGVVDCRGKEAKA